MSQHDSTLLHRSLNHSNVCKQMILFRDVPKILFTKQPTEMENCAMIALQTFLFALVICANLPNLSFKLETFGDLISYLEEIIAQNKGADLKWHLEITMLVFLTSDK